MKTILLTIFFSLILLSCSNKEKMTTSKIKILGGGIFSSESQLGTKANNGLILYGKSIDGKSFMRKIDSDVVEFSFPNGVWNFYVVSWEQATPISGFQGKTYCGKAENINLTGPDVAVNLNMSNANCADSAFTPVAATETGFQVLSKYEPVACRDVTKPTNNTDDSKCGRTSFNNRGYATYIKYVAYSYDKFNVGMTNFNEAFTSSCIKLDGVNNVNAPATSQPLGAAQNNLTFPDTINGFKLFMRVYYSSTDAVGCDDSHPQDRDELILENFPTPRTQIFGYGGGMSIPYKKKLYFESEETQVCRGNRLTTLHDFAGGFGTNYSPYILCTAEQFNRIGGANFTNNSTKNFELAADLNFAMYPIVPVGDPMGSVAGTNFTASIFEGNNHVLDNVFITSSSQDDVGIFRKASGVSFSNFTVRKIGVVADGRNNVGAIVGSGSYLFFGNIKISGHIEGYDNVGGILGQLISGSLSATKIHNVIDLKGNSYAGGIVGKAMIDQSSSITKSSVKGEVRSSSCNGSTQGIKLGGFFGFLNMISSGNLSIMESETRADVDGCTNVGGMFGYVSSSSNSLTITDSYIKAGIRATYNNSAVVTGGVAGTINIGSATLNITRSYVLAKKIYSNFLTSTPTNVKATAGSITASQSCVDYAVFDDGANYSDSNCNGSTFIKTYSALASTTNGGNFSPSIWNKFPGGAARLQMEKEDLKTSYLDYGDCSNGYSATNGSGTAVDPYVVCTDTQFLAMTPTNFYKIGDDIFLNGAQAQFSSGQYLIHGKGHKIYGAQYAIDSTPSSSQGIFKELSLGSKIYDLTFYAPKAISSGGISMGSTVEKIGILAGKNSGELIGVNLEHGLLKIPSIAGTAGTLEIGGVVGFNEGIMKNMQLDVQMLVGDTSTPNKIKNTSVSYLDWGGVAAINSGIIKQINLGGSLSLFYDNLIIASQNYVGLIVAKNKRFIANDYALVEEVKVQSSIELNSGTAQANVNVAALSDYNNGTINDILFASKFFMTASNFNFYKSINNNVGQAKRMFLSFDTSSLSMFDMTNASEAFCIFIVSQIDGCYQKASLSVQLNSTLDLTGDFYNSTPISTTTSMSDWDLGYAIYPDSNFPHVWAMKSQTLTGGELPDLIRLESGTEMYDNYFN